MSRTASARFPALGTTAVLCAADESGLAPARRELERELAEIDLACSRFRDDSELARLNATVGGGEHAVGRLLLEALDVALTAAAETDGLVDPTVGRTLRLAGYDRTFVLVRAREGGSFVARTAPVPGWWTLSLDRRRSTVTLPPGAELDLGATAKALAADRAARAAAAAAGCGVLVSLGGDVSVAGEPPAGGWPVRIAEDHAAPLDAPGPVVAISAGGLATSGPRVRRWRAGTTELHHIVDPRTGTSAHTPWRIATVTAASCVEANVAATAAIVLGDEGPAWLAERRLPARLVRENGGVVYVGGWPDDMEAAA